MNEKTEQRKWHSFDSRPKKSVLMEFSDEIIFMWMCTDALNDKHDL